MIADCGLRIEKEMNPSEMQRRTQAFAVRIIRLVEGLPRSRTADLIGRQLLRCGTSVGANYQASCRAKSPADFIAKMGIVEEEADEVLYWLDLLIEAGLLPKGAAADLFDEANQLVAVTVSSIKTARQNLKK